ncbi:beta-glucosidase precursor [Metschnikowia bicuspidata var. bicuspidata NRRL YB-4993]|uniref:beta-glucosidase n=1 Tax=Metschnikowia bicuspidata var. bicuspidata NRRL YB-4993 TaxID=869754 RepID=A0A1A0HG19_9ASCO|nr:beta-glucosidase precursor [Metschnikowia bicuspidata var. bicuspidata NRRL YB-4993]OBA22930.1 beta-glucosidase precursor [Metschnikowia bicuspidata var. bicuspidata NRRL YB-4993]
MADINVEEVLSQLTLPEKIGLLAGIDFWHTSGVKRLGVPSVRVSDGPNGVRGTKFCNGVPSACFPCGTGMAATFNKELLHDAGELMAKEAKSKSASCILGPTTNIQRGPLGGRGFESFSEDPYLAGMASAAVINGMQENDIASTLKHFVCNDLEHERSSSDSVLTERALREIYLEPFRLAVKNSNPASIMTSYNKVNGEHVSQSAKFLKDILRKEWGWDGLIMSDWFGVYTAKAAIENGLDLEMPGPSFLRDERSISHMIATREINIQDLDDRVRNVLKFVKWCARAKVEENGVEEKNDNPETRAVLNKLASEAVVLLKNEDNILPLQKNETLAVIGPNAKYAAYCGGGSASLLTYYSSTPFDSIAKKLGKNPEYSVGCFAHKSLPGISLSPMSRNPVTGKPGINVRFYDNAPDVSPRTQFDEFQYDASPLLFFDYTHPKIVDDLYYADITTEITPEESGDYDFSLIVCGTAKLFIDGKLLVDNTVNQKLGDAFFGSGSVEVINSTRLEAGKTYEILVQFGSAKTMSVKQAAALSVGGAIAIGFCKVIDPQEEIQKAAELASKVDKVVLSIGLNLEWESEGFDRPDMSLPPFTNELVSAVLQANPNTVVVNQSGTPVEMPWLLKAKALVHAWYGGSECGNAIANVLFGDVNPSGKLPLSWPMKNIDNPAYLNFKTVRGRVLYGEDIYVGYRYYEKLQRRVAFPFGYGKSYTSFEFTDLSVKLDESSDKLVATVSVENTGGIDGSETVQLYVAPVEPDVDRPLKELKGFEKVFLKAGEKRSVEFNLSLKDSVSYFDEYLAKWHLETGDYEVQVGSSSDDIEVRAGFKVCKEKMWTGL